MIETKKIDTVVFNGINSLDFHDVRMNVIRIPQVSARISEAQQIWDQKEDNLGFSFSNYLASEDAVFLSNIKLKSFSAAVVQVGLYDRYLKNFPRPQYVMGRSNGDSPLRVCAGKLSFAEMVNESLAMDLARPTRPSLVNEEPLLKGMSIADFAVYKLRPLDQAGQYEGFEEVESKGSDIGGLVRKLIDDYGVDQFINIGPGNILFNEIHKELALSEVQILESIDMDPMLSWFWPSMRKSEMAMSVMQ